MTMAGRSRIAKADRIAVMPWYRARRQGQQQQHGALRQIGHSLDGIRVGFTGLMRTLNGVVIGGIGADIMNMGGTVDDDWTMAEW